MVRFCVNEYIDNITLKILIENTKQQQQQKKMVSRNVSRR